MDAGVAHEVWAVQTMRHGRFADTRLHRRATLLLGQFARRPGDGILLGADDPAAAKADYRFLENARVSPDQLWLPVHRETERRLRNAGRVVCIQDSTCLMFPGLAATTGLGTVDTQREEALWMHSGLAVRRDGTVLGLLHNHVWARPASEFGKGARRKSLPIEEKESFNWLRTLRAVQAARDRSAGETRLIHVFDRGGDVHEVLSEIVAGPDDAVIRCGRNRKVEGPYRHMRATLAAQPVLNRSEIVVPRRGNHPCRTARVALCSVAGMVITPSTAYSGREPVTLNAVWVHEPAPPANTEPLNWLLLTTLPVDTVAACQDVVDVYKLRWLIEEFHLVLKSGCGIEATQLKTAERIEKLLVLLSAVAVRLLASRQKSRLDPDAPCTEILEEDAWRVLWIATHRGQPHTGPSPPTVQEAVRMIGRLGGHLGRKGDGPPGVRVLWRGWRDLDLWVQGYRAARS
jgi:hypothetical protein